MRIFVFGFFFLTFSIFSYSQNNGLNTWNKAITNCLRIENGSYKMEYKSKSLLNPDTVYKNLNCVFKRDSSDTIFGFYFDVDRAIEGISDYYSYSDNQFISGSDKEAKLFQSKQALNELISLQHNYDFFNPLNDFRNSEMSELDQNLIQFLGEEKVGSNKTFHYRFVPLKDTNDAVEILNSALDFWINVKDAVPVRYSVYYQVDLSGDTLEQYDEFTLVSYSLNNQASRSFKTPDFFVKKGIHISEYVSQSEDLPAKLSIGSQVPNWKFETNISKEFSLDNQPYSLVLFDFYYQGCYPCLKAIPFLNKLNKKYDLNGRGLLVVGINTIDPVDERFYDFIKKKQIEYHVAISPNDLNTEFKVLAYPTLFLMDDKGTLIYSSEGYGEQLEVELEKVIVEHLKKGGVLK